MRKILAGLAVVTAAAGIARAEVMAEAIPADFIQQFAPFAVQLIQQQFPNPPVKVDPAADKAQGYHVQEMVGVVIVPDKAVTGKSVEEATDKEVPLCVLATKSLSVSDKDVAVTGDRLATADFNGMFKVPVFFLSVKGKGADRTLEVYSKDGKAVTSVPMKKGSAAVDSPLSVKLQRIELDKKKMDATLSVGSYEGDLKLAVVDL